MIVRLCEWLVIRMKDDISNKELIRNSNFCIERSITKPDHFLLGFSWSARLLSSKSGLKRFNLVPLISSLRSSLEEETPVNAGHVALRFWEPLRYQLLFWGGFVRYLCKISFTLH